MNFKSLFRLILIALTFVLVSSSCLEITTETTLNKDGSGDQIITMDMAKLVESMGAMMFEGETPSPELFKEKMGADMMKDMDSTAMAAEQMEGLSNFNAKVEGYSVVMSFDFADMEALASFLKADSKMPGASENLELVKNGSKSTLSWRSSADALKEGMGGELDENAIGMMRGMLEGMNVTSIYHLPGKVKKVSDKETMTVSKDKKTVKYQVSMLDFLDGKTPEINSITFKN
jgi:hypothetical protein